MWVRVISFGSNWWAMHSTDESDPYRFRRGTAYFNAAAVMSGRRLHHSTIYPGQIRFNAKSGFNPEFPQRAIGRTFLCSGPNRIAGKSHLLFMCAAHEMLPDAYLVTLNSIEHGGIRFHQAGWRASGVRPVSVSRRGPRYEAMVLMGTMDWIASDLGLWKIDAAFNRLTLAEISEGTLK